MIYCPFHNNYRTPSGVISKTKGLFHCFGCHEATNLIELVMHCTKRSYFESVRLIKSKASEENIEDFIANAVEKKQEFTEFDTDIVTRLNTDALSSKRAAQYLMGRGITKSSVEKYLIGYSSKRDMITVPVYSYNNICMGMVGRSVEGKFFKNTPGLQKSKTLFNIQRNKAAKKIFLVESAFDAIRIEQVGGNAVAALGSKISSAQIDLLKKYFPSIIVVSDNDDAGRDMFDRLKTMIGKSVIDGSLPSEINDVSDLDDEKLKIFVDNFNDEIQYIIR